LHGKLNEIEKSEFREFLSLSYLNVSHISKKVLENLKDNPDFLGYLRKNFSERTVWNTLSEVTKLLEKFLESKKIISDSGIDKDSNLLHEFNGRIRSHYLYFKKELARVHTVKYYHGLFEEVYKRSFLQYQLVARGHDLKILSEVDNMITNFYSAKIILDILLLLKEDKFRKHIWNPDRDLAIQSILSRIDFRGAIEILKDTTPELYPVLKMYYLLYNLSLDPVNLPALRDVHFHLVQNSKKFSDRFKSEVYFTMFNCYIMMKNKGQSGVNREMFSMMKEKLNAGIINDLQNEHNEDNHFRDYVIIALSLDEVEWASDFVERYSHLLPESRKDNEAIMCKAFIEFKKREFILALIHLAETKRIDSMNAIDYYSMFIKCHFELGNSDECSMALRRFSESLKHIKQIPDNYIVGSQNFIRVMSKLLNYTADRTAEHLLDIELLINNSAMLFERKWLLSKISEINSTR